MTIRDLMGSNDGQEEKADDEAVMAVGLEKLQKRKAELEMQIMNLLGKFSQETGLKVTYIDVTCHSLDDKRINYEILEVEAALP